MKGIQYVVDEHGERTAVVLDLKEHGDLWEDIQDALLIESRRDEPRESLEEVKAHLRAAGKLSEDE